MTSDGETLLFEEVTDGVVGMVLLVGKFGIRPDLKRYDL